jgi:ATP-dependent DNA helicase PIF1
VNGSRGVVEKITWSGGSPVPVVRFDSGSVVPVQAVESTRKNPDGEGELARNQLPLKLAWAMTIHKSQGATLSRALLDVSNTFEYGQC